MNFPTLYKKTSTGAIQFWQIETGEYEIAWITTTYGQLGTDSPQTTTDYIKEGKNAGKKNATTAAQQADKEAKARWEKQKKKGYVDSKEAAEAEKLDELIEGGIVPMLAHKFTDHGHKIKYPAYSQPKLDGIRCIAILKNGKCTLWSRTRKPITSMPHIVKELEERFGEYDNMVFDGELYNHEFKNNFEHIVSMVRQDEPHEKHTDVEYHIYDLASDGTFKQRTEQIESAFHGTSKLYGFPKYLRKVPTGFVKEESEIQEHFDLYKSLGYEGAMIRNADALYVNKRSYDLLKVKEFDDGEFDIVGIEEGRGKLQGHAGAFLCRMPDGKTFLAKMSGETSRLKDYFLNHKLWEGKRLTVQYQGLTGKEGVPRFPVGIAIRDYE